jgi:hypothetical protein
MAADLLHRLEIAFGGQSPRSQDPNEAPRCPRACGAFIAGDDGDNGRQSRWICKPPPSSRGQCWSALGRGRSFFGERGIVGRLTAPIRAGTCIDALLENR